MASTTRKLWQRAQSLSVSSLQSVSGHDETRDQEVATQDLVHIEGLRHTKALVALHQLTSQAGPVCRFATEDAVHDLKAVNPREKRTTDTRTPAELLAAIEEKGQTVETGLARLTELIASNAVAKSKAAGAV
jgi:hypothetical protein